MLEVQFSDLIERRAGRGLRQVSKVSQLFDPTHGGDILRPGQQLFTEVGPDGIWVCSPGTGAGLNICFNVGMKDGVDRVVGRAFGTLLRCNRDMDQFPASCRLPLTKSNYGEVFVG